MQTYDDGIIIKHAFNGIYVSFHKGSKRGFIHGTILFRHTERHHSAVLHDMQRWLNPTHRPAQYAVGQPICVQISPFEPLVNDVEYELFIAK